LPKEDHKGSSARIGPPEKRKRDGNEGFIQQILRPRTKYKTRKSLPIHNRYDFQGKDLPHHANIQEPTSPAGEDVLYHKWSRLTEAERDVGEDSTCIARLSAEPDEWKLVGLSFHAIRIQQNK
jgi:hypothetical protein